MDAVDDLTTWVERITIEDAIFDLQPEYCAGLMAIGGLASGPTTVESDEALARAEAAVRDAGDTDPAQTQVELWREAFRSFGAKPKRTRPSVDALRRRATKDGLPRINLVTDVYNAVSVTRGVPIGVEDIDRYDGPLRLVRATGEETFDTTDHGDPVTETVDPGEPIWRDDTGATCRRWNWRQTTRTALTESTSRATFIVDALGPEALTLATETLAELHAVIAPGADAAIRTIHRS